MHGMCFNEGNAGRCGLRCRAFTGGECDIVEEMVFNFPITYSDFLDAKDIYPHLQGTEMKRITSLMLDRMSAHNKEMALLIAMTQVNWENLKVDEVVCVTDDLGGFVSGNVYVRHFKGLNPDNKKIASYIDGMSSATSKDGRANEHKFALPKEAYDKLISTN